MKPSARILALSAALAVGTFAHAVSKTNYDGYLASKPVVAPESAPVRERSAPPPAVVASTDDQRGVPTFLWADRRAPLPPQLERRSPERAARWYLRQHARRYGLTGAHMDSAVLRRVHDTGRGGIIAVFGQEMDGIDVHGTEIKVLLKRDLRLVAISGNLRPDAVPGGAGGRLAFRRSAPQALADAVRDLYRIDVGSSLMGSHRSRDGYVYFDLARSAGSSLRFVEPARVRKVFYPMPDRLVPAYFLELVAERRGADTDTFGYVIAADDGRVLQRRDLTDDAFTYRVWADTSTADLRPTAGPQADYSPHPTGTPDNSNPEFIAPSLITIDGFNRNPDGGSDPWLASDATVTTGNNVDAYADHYEEDGFTEGADIRADRTGDYVFDRVYDTALPPDVDEEQVKAAITQLFYVNNWLHDYWYDSGFAETAGNAQALNYGRGGYEGDPLLAEAQDALHYETPKKNNANMSTRADGASPRMQMYVWDGEQNRSLKIMPANKDLATGTAAFGDDNFQVSGSVVTTDDGPVTSTNPSSTDACTAILNNIAGKIALIDRGTCTFEIKSLNAQKAGAIAVIIADNRSATTPPGMANDTATPDQVTLGVLSILQADGNDIKAQLNAGTNVTADMFRESGVIRDGTIDNSIIAHEWGHYLHHRLVDTGTQQGSAQSEGLADCNALHMILKEGDDLEGVYAMSIYAAAYAGDSGYYGIRRYPYSVDFTKNPLTFKHIQDGEPLPPDVPHASGSSSNAEVHNAGEVWCAMEWEAYVALQKQTLEGTPRYSFDEVRRIFADYMVAGLMLAPRDATFTEQRDAILAAAMADDEENGRLIAEAFAVRGAGTCAVSPARDSTDLKGVVESYELAPKLTFVSVSLDDSVTSCDHDGYLDAGETGRLKIEVMNTGLEPLTDAKVVLTTGDGGVSFPSGTTVTFGEIAPFESGIASIEVALDGSRSTIDFLAVNLAFSSATTCVDTPSMDEIFRINLDDIPNSSTTETVESDNVVWTETLGVGKPGVWSRQASSVPATNHVFYGEDAGSLTDSRLESPSLNVSTTGNLIISFSHRYKYETSYDEATGLYTYWDGSVIELSPDNGKTWVDISTYVDPGYDGIIGNEADNPLMDRQAYVGQNPAWPNPELVTLNLGTQLKGKTIRIRFRIGADQAAEDFGWELDNIAFSGITNKPFPTVVADETELTAYYVDADGDGHAGTGDAVYACVAPLGYVTSADDCDDDDAGNYPGADEVCDGADNDCDGTIDEAPVDGDTWYTDADGDGYGDPEDLTVSCYSPDGYVGQAGDCDDNDSNASPGLSETCDGVDNDCDGTVDDMPNDGSAPEGTPVWYFDADGDHFGDSAYSTVACAQPEGYADNADDCDDGEPLANPDGIEVCDGIDNDCSGLPDDDAVDASTFYADEDDDHYGDPDKTREACEQPEHYVAVAGDCDDQNAAANPLQDEVCDGADNDCDGEVDDHAADAGVFYTDADSDGYGDADAWVIACSAPAGYVGDNDDCDDLDDSANPGAAETCDGVDNNCDGTIDEGDEALIFYGDADGDGYGDPDDLVQACTAPEGYVDNNDDCNDDDASTYPGAPEDGDGIDHNCDGHADQTGGDGDDDDDGGDDDDDDGDHGGGCSQAGTRGSSAGLLPLLTLGALAGLAARRRHQA